MNDNAKMLHAAIGVELTSDNHPSKLTVWLGGKFTEVDEGKVSMEYVVRDDMLNPLGSMHGGIMSLLIDEVMGAAVFSLGLKEFYTNINLSLDFVRSAKKGEVIIVKASPVKVGRRVLVMTCDIFNSSDKLIATGSANYVTIS